MKTPFNEGWAAGYHWRSGSLSGGRDINPYRVGWAREGSSDDEIAKIAAQWLEGWNKGHEAALAERDAEDDSRKRDAREGFDE